MSNKICNIIAFLLLFVGLSSHPVISGEAHIFGPVRYERDTGKPIRVATTFRGPSTGSGFSMIIRNGTEDGRHRVTSGTITLNGTEVLKESDFKERTGWVERMVSLAPSNELNVRLTGKPASFITLSIVGRDSAPTVSLSASPQVVSMGGSVALSWTSTDAQTCTIDQGIGNVPSAGSITVSPTRTTTYSMMAEGPGGTATASVTVELINSPPTANDDYVEIAEDTAVPLNVLANDKDTDGDPLSVVETSQGSHGSVVIAAVGSIIYSPEADFNGTDAFQYTVSDGRGGMSTAAVLVRVTQVNDSPMAAGQSISMFEDTATAVKLEGSDADGDPLIYVVTAPPMHGTLTGTPPTLQYTPTPNYSGPDAFTFKVFDGSEGSGPADVSIAVLPLNDPPAPVDDTAIVKAGSSVTLAVLQNDTDLDGDALILSSHTQPARGMVTNSGNGLLTYSPEQGFTGEDHFSYTVSDGNGGSAVGTVTITVEAPSGISLKIESPLDEEVIAGPSVLVEGTVSAASGRETGVVVNGVPAAIHKNRFMANSVPLQPGENAITAVATDSGGNSSTTSIRVTGETEGAFVRLKGIHSSGISPLETTLLLETSPDISTATLSCIGPSEVEYIENKENEEYRVRMAVEGVYRFTVQGSDAQGNAYSDSLCIVVRSREEMDGLFRAAWEGMKARLFARDIEGALESFLKTSRERYRRAFNALAQRLPQIASDMEDIEMIYCRGNIAKYRIKRDEWVNGNLFPITYYIYFALDEHGLWKVDRF